MTGLVFHAINLLILITVIVIFARKKLKTTFEKQHEAFKAQLQEANAKYELAKAEYEKISAMMSGLESTLAEMRLQSTKEIENESARIEREAERMIQQTIHDGELRINVETERLKASIEKDLLERALSSAQKHLETAFKTQDESWTIQMVESAGAGHQSRGKKNYAS